MPRRKAKATPKRRRSKKISLPPVMFRERLPLQKTWLEVWADCLTKFFGTINFLLVNILFFVAWIIWNSGLVPEFVAFDPYPFGMLTMIVSLEAIILSIMVLISQNRAAKMDEVREEVDFQIDLQSEKQISAVMQSLDKIMHHLEISHHEDSKNMRALDIDKLERRVIAEIDTD